MLQYAPIECLLVSFRLRFRAFGTATRSLICSPCAAFRPRSAPITIRSLLPMPCGNRSLQSVPALRTAFIEQGPLWKNGYIKSFNARLRDEFLNGEIFYTPKETQVPSSHGILRCVTTTQRTRTAAWDTIPRPQKRSLHHAGLPALLHSAGRPV